MSTISDDTGLVDKALRLERYLPEGRQPEFRLLIAELLESQEQWQRERRELSSQHQQYAEETIRLRERLRRLTQQMERLRDIFQANDHAFCTFRSALTLSRQLRDMDDLPDMLARLRQAMGVPILSCLLSREDFELYVPAGFPCPSARSLAAALKALPLPEESGRRVYVGGVAALARPEFFFDPAILAEQPRLLSGSCFIAPLAHKYRPKRRIGVLAIADPDPGRYTVDKGTDFLEHFCEVLAGDLLHVKIHEELTRKRESDELTGIPNRAYLHRHGPPLLSLAERRKSPVAMLFCDLNRFKAVNDTLGHETGDTVLRDVAHAMASRVRAYDLLARLGGDEFVLLMPDAGPQEAALMADRLRACVHDVAVNLNLDVTPGLSASVGVVQHEPGQGIEDLLRLADAAMYAEKRR